MPKNTTKENKINKDNWRRRMGVSIAHACEPRASFWRPLPTRESRIQQEKNKKNK
jgi:hypothetical protein